MAETDKKAKEEEKKPRRRVKKARGHAAHHGGAWKVAYADFVTAMMALFLVLWLVSQADTKLKQSIASYFRSPGVFDTQAGGILSGEKKVSKAPEALDGNQNEQSLISVGENLKKKFDTRPEFAKVKDQVKIEVDDEGLRIQLLDQADRISFPVGNAELTDEAKAVLAEIAAGICALPNYIKIGGHTDSRVFPSENGYTNWELSADRANAARRALQNACVKPEQIQRIIGYADTDPINPNDRFAPANRRISITVMRLENPNQTTEIDPNAKTEIKPAIVISERKNDKKSDAKTADNAKTDLKNGETGKSKTAAEQPKVSPESETLKTKLAQEGKVSIGEPDQLPPAPKSREPKP